MRKILLIVLSTTQIWSMDKAPYSRSANAVASLRVMAAACVSKNSPYYSEKISKLSLELQNLIDDCAKRYDNVSHLFPTISLPVASASMRPDTRTIAGIAQNPYGFSKLRFISKEREDDKSYNISEDMFPAVADDENRMVHLAWHPVKPMLAGVVDNTSNVVLIEANENNLLNRRGWKTGERTNRLNILQWSPNGDTLLAEGNGIIFLFPEHSNKQVQEVVYTDNSAINAAIWSESGKKILIQRGMYEVNVLDWKNQCHESRFSVSALYTPIRAVEWDDEAAGTILLATRYAIKRMQYQDRRFEESEYCNTSSWIEQILQLNKRYLLVKTFQHDMHHLNILDRLQKRVLHLHHVVCKGTLKLSTNKRFVYGDQMGDSLVHLSYLLDNQSQM